MIIPDATKRERCIEIMVGCSIKTTYREDNQIIVGSLLRGRMVGTILRHPVKDHLGVTQGGPSAPTIFNIVVDAVCNRVTLVAGEEAGPESFRQTVQWMAALLYADNRFTALT